MAKGELAKVKKQNENLKRQWKRARERQASTESDMIQTAGVVGGAYGAAYMRARYPDKFEKGIMGADPSAVTALALGGLALSGAAGEATPIVLGVGQGAAAEFVVDKGRTKGEKDRQNAKK